MQERRPEVLVVSIVFFTLASVFVALRFISRLWIVRKLVLHDYLMLLAWVCLLLISCSLHGLLGAPANRILTTIQVVDFGFSFALFYATSQGLGLHDVNIPVSQRANLSRANYAFTVLYVSFRDCTAAGFR